MHIIIEKKKYFFFVSLCCVHARTDSNAMKKAGEQYGQQQKTLNKLFNAFIHEMNDI